MLIFSLTPDQHNFDVAADVNGLTTHLKCAGMFNNNFITSLLPSLTTKEF